MSTPITASGLLALAGITPTAEELAAYEENYPVLRAGADRLYEIREARYVEPALVWSPPR
jgi:hypothetical protein